MSDNESANELVHADVYERIISVTKHDLSVRLWAQSQNLRDLKEAISQRDTVMEVIGRWYADNHDFVQLAEDLSMLAFCNAVEVTPQVGDAVIIYPTWP